MRLAACCLALAAVAIPAHAQAPPPIAFGTLSNFDVYNTCGQEAEGFEIELEGLTAADVPYTFGGTYNRYGTPTLTDAPGRVFVRYTATWDPVALRFNTATPVPPAIVPTQGHLCWSGGSPNYPTSGCEHFGVSMSKNPTATHYRWLVADPSTPGALIPHVVDVTLAAPVWAVAPNPVPAAPPIVAAVLPAPPQDPVAPKEFGPAQWLKVYVTEVDRDVDLHELLPGNPVVPNDTETEVEWVLLQKDFNSGAGDELNEAAMHDGMKAVVRRYELYEYAGPYDLETGEALCLTSCSAPTLGEPTDLGEYIGAQLAAVNVGPPSPQSLLKISFGGKGSVSSDPAGIDCTKACSHSFVDGTNVDLTATRALGYTFAGWSGACTNLDPTCQFVPLTGATTSVKANFTAIPKPSVTLSSGDQVVGENVGSVLVTATQSAVSDFLTKVPFAFTGTAKSGKDYTKALSYISIPSGSTDGSLTLAVLDDTTFESDETIVLTMGTPTGATKGAVTASTITIQANDSPPTVAFSVAKGTAMVGSVPKSAVAVKLSAVSGKDTTVTVTATGGTAVAGVDYTLIETLTIPAGKTSAFAVSIPAGTPSGVSKTATFSLSAPVNATLGLQQTEALTIKQ